MRFPALVLMTPALLVLIAAATFPATTFAFEEKHAPFEVALDGDTIPYALFTFTALPETAIEVTFPEGRAEDYRVARTASSQASIGGITLQDGAHVFKTGAAPALDVLAITNAVGDSVLVNVFTMAPLASVKNGELNGFRIGEYPKDRYRGLDSYAPPPGFIEVTEENRATLVSPHFRLEQFLCKQTDGYPKYVALRPGLLHKLEIVLREANRAGFETESFVVMSGFRSPFYNKSISGKKYSRHMWGGAADIYIDENPRDGVMDDLNGDGALNRADAVVLYKLVERLGPKPWYRSLVGGLGSYGKNSAHGPFVHVDVRGFRARW